MTFGIEVVRSFLGLLLKFLHTFFLKHCVPRGRTVGIGQAILLQNLNAVYLFHGFIHFMFFVGNIRLVALHLKGIEMFWKLIDNAGCVSNVKVAGMIAG